MTPTQTESFLARCFAYLALVGGTGALGVSADVAAALVPWVTIVVFPGGDCVTAVRESAIARGVDVLTMRRRLVGSRIGPLVPAYLILLVSWPQLVSFYLLTLASCFAVVAFGCAAIEFVRSPTLVRASLLVFWSIPGTLGLCGSHLSETPTITVSEALPRIATTLLLGMAFILISTERTHAHEFSR